MFSESAGQLLDEAGRHVSARDFAAAGALVSRALKLEPMNVRGLCFEAIVAAEIGRKDAALMAIQRALELAPHAPGVVNNAACIYFKLGESARAMEMWGWLDKTMPPSAEVSYNLALCHLRLKDPDSAEVCFRKVIQLAPNHRDVHINLGNLVKSAGRIEEAITIFRQGLQLHPGDLRAHSNLLYAMHFDPAFGPEEIVRHAAAWGKSFEAAIPAYDHYENDPSPDRQLRIGYISPNFRDHAATYFYPPLLKDIDRSAFETHIYSCNLADDAITPSLRGLADSWRDVAAWDDQALAQTIRQDRIDVLVDLTMHMDGGRLGVFARKPVPIQVTWLAYPSTTGLTRIDYCLIDPHLYSHNAAHFTESPYVLPASYWCYEVYGPQSEVSPLPAAGSGGGVTFGCLNNPGKLTRQILQAWALILRRVDGSRLLLHVESPGAADAARAILVEMGVDPQRLACQPRVGREAYLRTYHVIDIALDPFPYNGHTTTLDALWMGVPVVSLAGATAVSRAGLSILSNIGLPELVAQTWDQYIAIAQGLAADLPRLQQLRQSLRKRMEQSVVMDAKAFAAAMGHAYRDMWQRWCSRT